MGALLFIPILVVVGILILSSPIFSIKLLFDKTSTKEKIIFFIATTLGSAGVVLLLTMLSLGLNDAYPTPLSIFTPLFVYNVSVTWPLLLLILLIIQRRKKLSAKIKWIAIAIFLMLGAVAAIFQTLSSPFIQ